MTTEINPPFLSDESVWQVSHAGDNMMVLAGSLDEALTKWRRWRTDEKDEDAEDGPDAVVLVGDILI